MAAGISPTPLSHSEVEAAMKKSIVNMEKLLTAFIADNDPVPELCNCRHAMAEFGGFKL